MELSRARFRLGVALLLAVHLGMLVALAWTTPLTADEGTYCTAGEIVRRHLRWDAHITYAHGPLPFFANQSFAWLHPTHPLPGYAFWGRLGMLPFALLAALATTWLATRAFGRRAGLLALGLLVLQPMMLAHGCLMATDMSLVGFYVLAVFAAWRFFAAPRWSTAVGLGAVIGMALATKYLGVFLVVVLGINLVWELLRGFRPGLWWSRADRASAARRVADAAAVVAVCAITAWGALWACYSFAPPGYDPATAPPMSELFGRLSDSPPLRTLLGVLPQPWVQGLDYMKAYAENGDSYLLGEIAKGHLAYYAVGLLVKLPLVVVLLVPIGLLVRRPAWPAHLRTPLLLGLLVPLAYMSLFQTLQVGLRHALQVIPLLIVVAARPLAHWWASGGRLGRSLVVGSFVALLTCHAITWPRYVESFNSLVGDRPYLWFRDSNLAWDSTAVSPPDELAMRARHPGAQRVYATSGPRFGEVLAYGPDLCATADADGRCDHWLRRLEPSDRIGAWFVFDVDETTLAQAPSSGARERDAVDLAAALAVDGDPRRALEVIGDAEGVRADAVRSLASGSARGQARAIALELLGRFDLVADSADASPLQRSRASVNRQDFATARDVLRAAAAERPLDLAEAGFLTLVHLWLGEHDEGLAVLDSIDPALTADPAIAPGITELRERLTIERSYVEVVKRELGR